MRKWPVVAGIVVVVSMVVGVLAFGAYRAADEYVLTNEGLETYAYGLLPHGAEVTVEHRSQCNRSGFAGMFTLRDTCLNLAWRLDGTTVDQRRELARANAEAQGWTVVRELNRQNGFELARPGFRGVTRVVGEEERAACLAHPTSVAVWCNDTVGVMEE